VSGRILEPGQERITYMFAGDASSSEKKIATERTRQSAARIHARADGTAEARHERSERPAFRIVGLCFLGLAVYGAYESVTALVAREAPIAVFRVIVPQQYRRS
jgi:hypothetical protein